MHAATCLFEHTLKTNRLGLQESRIRNQRFGHNVWLKYGPEAFGCTENDRSSHHFDKIVDKTKRRWFVGDIYNMRTGDIPLTKKLRSLEMDLWSMGLYRLVSIAALVAASCSVTSKIFLSTIMLLCSATSKDKGN